MSILKPFKVDLPLEVYLENDFNREVYNSYHLIDKDKFNCEYDLKIFFDDLYSIIGTVITNYNFEFDIVNYLEDIFNNEYRLKELVSKEEKYKSIKKIGVLISLCNTFFNDIVVNDFLVNKHFFGNKSIYDKMYSIIDPCLWNAFYSIDKNEFNIENCESLDDYFFDFIPWSNDALQISQLQKFLSNSILSVPDYLTMYEYTAVVNDLNMETKVFQSKEVALLAKVLTDEFIFPEKNTQKNISDGLAKVFMFKESTINQGIKDFSSGYKYADELLKRKLVNNLKTIIDLLEQDKTKR